MSSMDPDVYKTWGLGFRDIHGVEQVYEVYTSLSTVLGMRFWRYVGYLDIL